MKFFSGTARRWLIGVGVGVAVGLVTLLGALEFLELKSLDLRFLLRGPFGRPRRSSSSPSTKTPSTS